MTDHALMEHRTTAELEAGLDHVRGAPTASGVIELIVSRPGPGERQVLDEGELTHADGLAGDTWLTRGSRHSPDGSSEVARQLTIMSARAAALFAGERERWPLAGDQVYVDLDISVDNLPPGTRMRLGDATVEISEALHTGCAKFATRFGREALRLVGTEEGRRLRLRGLNAIVVEPGTIRPGDDATVIRP
jgi:hypothetical protein